MPHANAGVTLWRGRMKKFAARDGRFLLYSSLLAPKTRPLPGTASRMCADRREALCRELPLDV